MRPLPLDAFASTRPVPTVGAGLPAPVTSKRILDLACVLVSAPIVLPLLAVLWLLVRRDGGPGFFRQTRIGQDGRLFSMWKLRSMVPDAEAHLSRLLSQNDKLALEWQHRQKLDNDPRLTPLGRFLRRYSLDELPQLWNVWRGEMSLIGPRPFLPAQKALYDAVPGSEAYYRVRPGLGGPWQVGERHRSAFATRVRYDRTYVETMTLTGDVLLIARSALRLVVPSGS